VFDLDTKILVMTASDVRAVVLQRDALVNALRAERRLVALGLSVEVGS